MNKLLRVFLVPLLGGVALGSALELTLPECLAAVACECSPDAFWVLASTQVVGPAVQWPADGQLGPDQLQVWAKGFTVTVQYAP